MCERGERPKLPPCCAQKAGSACASPTPRATNNYYSRHHYKNRLSTCVCKGSCYCPEGCNCAHSGLKGRFAEADSCDPNVVAGNPLCGICDKMGDRCRQCQCCCCCSSSSAGGGGCGGGGKTCCVGGGGGTLGGDAGGGCCKMRGRQDKCDCCCLSAGSNEGKCCSGNKGRSDKCGSGGGAGGGGGCCAKPYTPPCRKPVCYPPIRCCETNECGAAPKERICYYPCPARPQPKYCTCGSPNPCECDLNLKRQQAICDSAPCCRRCGRKVYAAEKIMASGGAFHTACFSCYCCHKPLEVTNVYDNQGEIYCKQCYAKYFGVTGYGYGSTLQSSI